MRFESPTEFRLDRPRNYHLTFGAGPYVCLGLKLARLETQVALEQLFTRFPDLQPVFDPQHPNWSKRPGMRAIKSMPIRIDQVGCP